MSQDDTEYLQEARKLFKFTELVIQKHKKTDLLKHSQPFRRAQIENVLRTKYRGYMRQVHQVVDPSTSKADVLLYSGRKDLVPWESKAIRSIRKDISFDRKYYEMNETDCTTEDCKIALDEYCTNILSSTESLLNTLNNLTNAPKAESLQVTESEIAPANINEIEIPKGPRGTPLQRSSTDVLSKVPTSTCTQQKTNGNTAEAGTDLELLGNNGTFPNSATEEMKNMAEPRKDSKLFPTGPRKSADSSEHQPHMAANVANCPITENSDRIKDRYTAEAGNVMKTKQRSVIAPSPMQSNEINPVEVKNPATESNEINPVEMKNPATESNEINPVEVKNPATESYADVKVPKAVSVANKATSPSSNNVKTTEKDNGASTNIANNPKETKKDIKFLEDGLLLCRRGTMTELLRSILSENSSKTNRKEKSSGNPTVPETHPSTDHAAIASTNTVNSQVCNGRDVQLTTNSNKKRGLSTPKEIKLTKKMKSARTQENMVESVKNSTTTLTTLLGKPDIEQDIMQVPKNIVNMSKPSFGTPPPPPPSYSNNKKLISPGRLQSLIDTKDRMMECHDLKSDLIMISNSGTYTGNTTDETKKKKETANPLSALLNSLEAETHEASNKSAKNITASKVGNENQAFNISSMQKKSVNFSSPLVTSVNTYAHFPTDAILSRPLPNSIERSGSSKPEVSFKNWVDKIKSGRLNSGIRLPTERDSANRLDKEISKQSETNERIENQPELSLGHRRSPFTFKSTPTIPLFASTKKSSADESKNVQSGDSVHTENHSLSKFSTRISKNGSWRSSTPSIQNPFINRNNPRSDEPERERTPEKLASPDSQRYPLLQSPNRKPFVAKKVPKSLKRMSELVEKYHLDSDE